MESVTENNRHGLSVVRVKTGGKSARHLLVIINRGQTLLGARQNSVFGVRYGLNTRVCRIDK